MARETNKQDDNLVEARKAFAKMKLPETILTARPADMSYAIYRQKRRAQKQDIQDYMKWRVYR